jgi:rhomboid family GlyGly-CTERM serine protease
VPVAIAILAVIIAAFGAAGAELLKYDRLAIGDGEYWRLLSGHFAHLGPEHLLLNLAGLVLVWLLVGRQYTTPQWLIVTAFSLVIISLGFWFLDRNLIWYVGLSGLLHGLLIAGAIRGIKTQAVEAIIIIAAVAAKLIYEQFLGPLPGSEATAGGAVITNAHLYGAFGGAIVAILLWRRVEPAASI